MLFCIVYIPLALERITFTHSSKAKALVVSMYDIMKYMFITKDACVLYRRVYY